MNAMETILATLFWSAAAAALYTYCAYPAVVYALSRAFGANAEPPEVADADLPSVALLIVAHNEEDVIEERIQNAIRLEYPRRLLRIVVASDGSDDRTASIVRRYGGRVRLLDYSVRRGKSATLNATVAMLDAEVLVLSDANTCMERDAVKRLARWFSNPDVGVVCGRLVLNDPQTGRNVDSLYWRYETFLKKCESRLGALLGANGGIYGVRRSVFQPLPPQTIIDDFVLPLLAKMRSGCRIIYDCEAVASEETAADLGAEFRRRARIGAGGFQAIGLLWRLLDPRYGWVSVTFFSHKLLRWFCPFFLLAALVTNIALCRRPGYLALLSAQVVFYCVCIVGNALPAKRHMALKLLRVPAMFAGMNAALLAGFVHWLRGTQRGTWVRTARAPELKQAA